MKYKIESWRFSFSLREDDSKTEVYYSSLELANKVLDDTLQKHLAFLDSRNDIDKLFTGKNYEVTRTEYEVDTEHTDLTIKVVWWRKHPKGVVAMKDYFYIDHDIFEREVLDEA